MKLAHCLSILASLACSLGTLGQAPEKRPEPGAAVAPPATPNTDPLVVEAIVNAPPAELWRVFTTADGYRNLGVAKAEIDLRVGGLMRSHYNPEGVLGDEGTIQNQIISFEPMRMISFRIHTPPKGFPFKEAWKSTWSVATFTDLGDGRTHVRLATMGYGPDEESQKMRAFFEAGNGWVMKKLVAVYDANAQPATGAAHAESPLAPIELQAVVSAPREEAWTMYTTSAGWKKFLGVESVIEPVPGGRFEVYFSMDRPEGARGSEGCKVLSLDPGVMFSYSWNAPPHLPNARAERTWVVVNFDELAGDRTRVRIKHMGFAEKAAEHPEHGEEWKKTRAYFAGAWPKVLAMLQVRLEHPNAPTGDSAPISSAPSSGSR